MAISNKAKVSESRKTTCTVLRDRYTLVEGLNSMLGCRYTLKNWDQHHTAEWLRISGEEV